MEAWIACLIWSVAADGRHQEVTTMNKTMIIAVVLGILLVLTGVQAFQINAIKEKITAGGVSVKAATGGASVPSGLANLPTMVGGC